ncbi:hypothetical protein [Phaeobacter sp. C3_T13_0]
MLDRLLNRPITYRSAIWIWVFYSTLNSEILAAFVAGLLSN